MAKLYTLLFVLLFSFSSISTLKTDDDDDYDFFEVIFDLFGLGSSEEKNFSFENKDIKSEFHLFCV